MSKREDYKRFIIFLLASLIVLAQMAIFAYVWYNIYRGQINKPFWRKGNWVLIAIYGLLFGLFSKLYGGLKVGYLKLDRCILFPDSGTSVYQCGGISADYFDQQMVPGSMANDRDDRDPAYSLHCMDLGFPLYLFQAVPCQEAAGYLRRQGSGG